MTHFRKYLLLFGGFSFLFFNTSFAQIIKGKKMYTHHFDLRNFNMGFQMGYNHCSYKVKELGSVVDDGIILDHIEPHDQPGINLGMIVNLNLLNNLNIRMIPAVSLEARTFTFYYQNHPKFQSEVKQIEAACFDFPLLFQFRSNYYKRTRLYVETGPMYSLNVQNNKKLADDNTKLKVKGSTFNWVVGVGLNLYGERIKLTPELRYSIALNDEYSPRNTLHANAIQSLFRQVIALNILFE